ncbi:hypothetical protein EDD85DRAFT_954690 [Armillaria nabsnona]|nr:hypothetical protein EDD85DRAFT_954690 [Armillaria nabsnona]
MFADFVAYLGTGARSLVELHQLDRASHSTSAFRNYLQAGIGGKHIFIFLYHTCSATAPLRVFATFSPRYPVKLHIDAATRRQPIPKLEATYADLKQKRQETYWTSPSITYEDRREFTTTYQRYSTDATALKAISRKFGLMEDKSYTLVISSSKDQSYFGPIASEIVQISCTLDVFP